MISLQRLKNIVLIFVVNNFLQFFPVDGAQSSIYTGKMMGSNFAKWILEPVEY